MRYGKDLALAFRSFRSGGRFILAVLLLLALGVGATTAMFSVVNGVLLRPLALPDPGQLMLIGERIPQMPQTVGLAWFDNLAAFSAWQREANDFTGMSLIISRSLSGIDFRFRQKKDQSWLGHVEKGRHDEMLSR